MTHSRFIFFLFLLSSHSGDAYRVVLTQSRSIGLSEDGGPAAHSNSGNVSINVSSPHANVGSNDSTKHSVDRVNNASDDHQPAPITAGVLLEAKESTQINLTTTQEAPRPVPLSLELPKNRLLRLDSSLSDGFAGPGLRGNISADVNVISAWRHVKIIFFDFDGTLTNTPGGEGANPLRELKERTPLLTKYLTLLGEAGILVGILSKRRTDDLRSYLATTKLTRFFTTTVEVPTSSLGGKVSEIQKELEGKYLVDENAALVDADYDELKLARGAGVHTYPAPKQGGLTESDFEAIMHMIGVWPHRCPVPKQCCQCESSNRMRMWALPNGGLYCCNAKVHSDTDYCNPLRCLDFFAKFRAGHYRCTPTSRCK